MTETYVIVGCSDHFECDSAGSASPLGRGIRLRNRFRLAAPAPAPAGCFRVALGSAREVDVHLRLLQSIGTVDRQKAEKAVELFDQVRAMTWRLLHPRR